MRILVLVALCLSVSAAAYKSQSAQVLPKTTPGDHATDILFQSTDGGNTWQDFSHGLPKDLLVNRVFAQDGEVYLAANGSLYHNRDPKTDVWGREEIGLSLPEIKGVFEHNKWIGNIFSGYSGHYVSVIDEGLYQKASKKNTWEPIKTPRIGENINALVENPDGSLLVGCLSGLYKSTDKGKTWTQVYNQGWCTSLCEVNGILIGSAQQGLLRSTDGGNNWACILPDDGGVYNINAIGNRFAAIRVAGRWRDINDPTPQRTSISDDGGKTWNCINDGMSPIGDMNDLKLAGEYLFCNNKTGIYRSADGGIHWKLVRPTTGLKEPQRIKMVTSGQSIFAVKVMGGC